MELIYVQLHFNDSWSILLQKRLDAFVTVYLEESLGFFWKMNKTMWNTCSGCLVNCMSSSQNKMQKECIWFCKAIACWPHCKNQYDIYGSIKKLMQLPSALHPLLSRNCRCFSAYARFAQDSVTISAPLHNLLHKKWSCKWWSVEQNTFKGLKNALVSAPVLQMPDFLKSFVI